MSFDRDLTYYLSYCLIYTSAVNLYIEATTWPLKVLGGVINVCDTESSQLLPEFLFKLIKLCLSQKLSPEEHIATYA